MNKRSPCVCTSYLLLHCDIMLMQGAHSVGVPNASFQRLEGGSDFRIKILKLW